LLSKLVAKRSKASLCGRRAVAEGKAAGPSDDGYPIWCWAFVASPGGNILEISYGQEIGLIIGLRIRIDGLCAIASRS
jgi:hypothetical protein